jgi:CRP/FNR family cyclic AMP-dependent transcriptional regulator
MHVKTPLDDPEARANAIARAAPFSAWPRDVLLRLGAASSVNSHLSATALIVNGRRCDTITVPVAGAVIASVSSPGGRRVVFKLDDAPYAYGLAALVDGLPLPHDLLADGPVTVVRIPHAAIRAELKHLPSLWESIAVEVNRRGRSVNMQMQQFVFDAPQVRAASLLLGMLARSGSDGGHGPTAIDLRLPQERLAELLGTSRQWVTAVVRELSRAGLVEWRYGRVTVLDVQALRSMASRGIDAAAPRSERPAAQWHLNPAKAPAAGAKRRAN